MIIKTARIVHNFAGHAFVISVCIGDDASTVECVPEIGSPDGNHPGLASPFHNDDDEVKSPSKTIGACHFLRFASSRPTTSTLCRVTSAVSFVCAVYSWLRWWGTLVIFKHIVGAVVRRGPGHSARPFNKFNSGDMSGAWLTVVLERAMEEPSTTTCLSRGASVDIDFQDLTYTVPQWRKGLYTNRYSRASVWISWTEEGWGASQKAKLWLERASFNNITRF